MNLPRNAGHNKIVKPPIPAYHDEGPMFVTLLFQVDGFLPNPYEFGITYEM